jgi:uncharacterized delta-60 repeat protein
MPQQSNNTAPSFTVGNGKHTLDGYGNIYGQSVFVQNDGNIIVAGTSVNGALSNLAVIRYHPDGTLDTSFSNDGILIESFFGAYNSAQSIDVQHDGTITIAGKADNGSSSNLAVARYNSDGTLDSAFYGGGDPISGFQGSTDLDQSMVVQDNGKIIAIGEYGYRSGVWYADFVVRRYTSEGLPDITFSDIGSVMTSIQRINMAESVIVQQDGKILVAGYADYDGGSFVLVRYNIDGSLDTSFSADGILITPLFSAKAYSIKQQQVDGKILVTGTTGTDVALLRYNIDGSLDTTFSGDGIVTTDFGSTDEVGRIVTVQDDGRIIVGCAVDGHTTIVRYLSNGSLETIFDQAVIFAQDIVVQDDGKILVVDSAQNNLALVSYNSDGTLDASVGMHSNTLGGTVSYTEGGPAVILDSNVQVYDAELFLAGSYGGALLHLMRHGGANAEDVFSARGTLGALIAGNSLVVGGITVGNVTLNSGGELGVVFSENATQKLVNSVLQQIAYTNSSDVPPAVVQIDWTLSDGTLSSHDAGSSTIVAITASNDAPTGSVIISGSVTQYSTLTASNTLADKDGLGNISYQWKANGVLIDGAVNNNYTLTQSEVGKAISVTATYIDGYGTVENITSASTMGVANVNDAPLFIKGKVVSELIGGESVALQSDGKILVAGTSNSDLALVRYKSDGDLDFTFADNGIGISAFYGHDIYALTHEPSYGRGVAVQVDGKIIIVGDAISESQQLNAPYFDVAIARYNIDGSLDSSFSDDGKLTFFSINKNDYGNAVTVQPDGKILVAGYSSDYYGEHFIIKRLNSDGSYDASFSAEYGGGYYSRAESIAVQPDGKILVAGYAVTEGRYYDPILHEYFYNFNNYNFRLLRLNHDGTLDETFGENLNGVIDTDLTGKNDYGYSVIVQPDGKIVIAGQIAGGGTDLALVRYDSWGMPDTSFDGDGKVIADADRAGGGASMTLQSDGKIVLAGGNSLFRYNSDGSLDSSFSGDGKLIIAEYFSSTGVVVQSDGKIIVAGALSSFALFRYNSDGSIDESFGVIKRTAYNSDTDIPVLIDNTLQISDMDLAAGDNYSGASLQLSRHGGANAQDLFSSTSNLRPLIEGSDLVVENIIIGTTTINSGGILSVTFNNNATSYLLHSFVHKIAYSNSYDELSGSIQIDWTFSDGNSGYQGAGGPLSAINSTLICVTAVNDAPVVEVTDVAGAVTELVTPIGNLTDSGTIGFTDVDLADSHSITSVTASAGALGTLTPTITTDTTGSGLGGVVSWNYTVAASAVEYLAEGEHKVEAFTFSVLDGHGGSTERTVEVVITGTSDGNSAGVFDLAGAVTFWKSGAAIAGVTTTLASVPPATGKQPIEFRNIQIAADGTRTIEIWETSARTDIDSVQLELALPTGSIATWEDAAGLPSGWSSVANTGLAGQFILGGMGITALSAGPIKLGTLTLTASTDAQHFELSLSKGQLGSDAVPVFGISSDNMITTLDGLYHYYNMAEGSYALTSAKVSGIAESNAVMANDALAALKIVVGMNPNSNGSAVSPYQYLAADVNHDGQVKAADALNILKMAVKLDTAPAKEWLFVTESVGSESMSRTNVVWPDNPIPVTLDMDQELNLIGIVTGDVNGSWVA